MIDSGKETREVLGKRDAVIAQFAEHLSQVHSVEELKRLNLDILQRIDVTSPEVDGFPHCRIVVKLKQVGEPIVVQGFGDTEEARNINALANLKKYIGIRVEGATIVALNIHNNQGNRRGW